MRTGACALSPCCRLPSQQRSFALPCSSHKSTVKAAGTRYGSEKRKVSDAACTFRRQAPRTARRRFTRKKRYPCARKEAKDSPSPKALPTGKKKEDEGGGNEEKEKRRERRKGTGGKESRTLPSGKALTKKPRGETRARHALRGFKQRKAPLWSLSKITLASAYFPT